MPTARELLEQADALMRRNRSGGADSGIPVLTDRVSEARAEPSRRGPSTRERNTAGLRVQAPEARSGRSDKPRDDRTSAPPPAPRAEAPGKPEIAPAAREPAAPARDAEPPLLTDRVEEVAFTHRPADQAEDDVWFGPETVDPALHSITGPAPDTLAVVPPVTLRAAAAPPQEISGSGPMDLPDPSVTRTFRAAGSAATPPPAGSTPPEKAAAPPEKTPAPAGSTSPEKTAVPAASDDERWRALAEQISMQVLQRLDLFIDTGLKAQLASHLQPIVARASAELVETINDRVGQLVRTYVAEAIEREIAQWREDQR